MEFKSKLSDIKIERKKSDKQRSEIENNVNLYDARGEVIKFYKYHSTMMHNASYDATHRKGLKILNPEQML